MKKFKFNFSFLDRFKKKNDVEDIEFQDEIRDDNEYTNTNAEYSEYDSEESPEDSAEKTLSGFDLSQHQQDLQDAEAADGSRSEEMILPTQPDVAKRFSFKFPKFNREQTTSRIKAKFAGKSPINSFEKFRWNDFVLRLFSPYTRGKIHAVFIILLVITATYMLGKNMALLFNKAPPIAKMSRPVQIPMEKADTSVQDINKITSTNLFNAKESDKASDNSAKKDIDSIICLDSEKPTSLQIKLLDTIVLQDSVKSVASVQVRGSSELMNVREGERLDQMAEVSKITRLKMILKNLETGDCEFVS